jgi:hypothetical protein
MSKLKYIDWRKITFPDKSLKNYPNGTTLPHGDNIIEVTEEEKSSLLKARNGNNPCWEEVRAPRKKIEEENISTGEDE